MKTSFKRILAFNKAANDYLDTLEDGVETKLSHSIKRVSDQLPDIQDQINRDREDMDIDHANVDANGSILRKRNDKGIWDYEMKPDQVKAHREASRKLFEEDRYEIEPHICDEEVDEIYKEAFKDFVI